jgi:hypothetical protein
MKTSFLKRLAGVSFALVVATSAFSQGMGFRHNANSTAKGIMLCINQIDNLTDQQEANITALANNHREEVAALRAENRSTVGFTTEKNGFRQLMAEKRESHRDAVKAILNPDQQKQFESVMRAARRSYNSLGQGANFKHGNGKNSSDTSCASGNGKHGHKAFKNKNS